MIPYYKIRYYKSDKKGILKLYLLKVGKKKLCLVEDLTQILRNQALIISSDF